VKPWPNKAQTGDWCPSNLEHDDVFQLSKTETPRKSLRCESERSILTEHRERRRIALQGRAKSASQPPESRVWLEAGRYALDFSPYRRLLTG
jgi:hypothetical protein